MQISKNTILVTGGASGIGLALATRLLRAIALSLIAFAATANAFAYGREGHQAIALAARIRLSPTAREAIRKLNGNDDLAAIALWADQLKEAHRQEGPLAADVEAFAFNEKFPNNGKWHFLDLPLGTVVYHEVPGHEDVVQAIDECVAILEAPKGQATRFEKKQALRLLVHFVGDIHQPLHVGSGFYDLSGPVPRLIEDPAKAEGHPNDLGGNLVRFGPSHFSELHAYWDDELVERAAHTRDYEKLASALLQKRPRWETPGDYHHWAAAWATDSVHEARAVYAGIVFESAELGAHGKLKLIHARLPEDYGEKQETRAVDQLAKAAFRLAALLNAIRWR